MEKFIENSHSFEYSGNLHSADDTNNSDGEEDNGCQTINLEAKDVDQEIDEPTNWVKNWYKKLDVLIVTDDEWCA